MSRRLLCAEAVILLLLSQICWQNWNTFYLPCSRERSRIVRTIIYKKFVPIFERYRVEMPLECPFHPERDFLWWPQVDLFERLESDGSFTSSSKTHGIRSMEAASLSSSSSSSTRGGGRTLSDSKGSPSSQHPNPVVSSSSNSGGGGGHNHPYHHHHHHRHSHPHSSHQFYSEEESTGWICPFCGKSFLCEERLTIHWDEEHRPNFDKTQDSVCLSDYCDIMRCDAITSSRRRRKFKTDQKESQTQNENESQRVGQQSGSGSGSSTSLDKEEEDERTNCSSARMEKLEFKCRSVVRQCILSLLTTSLSMKDFQDIEDDLLKAICSYLNCDKFWTDITRDSQSRSIPLAICILIGILLIGGFSVCYYIVWTLFEGPLNFGGETSVVNVTRREGNRETSNGLKLVPASQQKQQQQQQQQQHQNGNHKQQQQHHIVRSASTGPGSTPSRPSNLIIHPKMPYRSRPKILITSPSVRRSPLARSMSSQSGHHFYRHQEQSRLRQEQQEQHQHQSIQRSLPLSSSGSSGYLPLRRSRYTSPIEASLSEEVVTKPESCPDVQLALVSRRKEVDSRKTPSSILSLTTPLREPIPPSHMHHHNSSGQIVYHSSRDHYYYYHEPSSRHTRGHSYQNHPSSSPLSSSSPPSSGSTQPKRGGQFVAILGSESADNTSRTPSKEEPRSTQSTPV